jgi:hypothetical protein
VCVQCGISNDAGELLQVVDDRGEVLLHRQCITEWKSGDIPDFLDRRDELLSDTGAILIGGSNR